jgi:hypothetical protein
MRVFSAERGAAFMTLTEEIDACDWLFLEDITEPVDNELRLKLVEAQSRAGGGTEDGQTDEVLGEILRTASIIEPRTGCRIFEVSWPSYVAYSIRNESFCKVDAYEEFDGKVFVRYARSRYLDFVANATFADSNYPGPFVHFGIFCQNHIIDVVSVDSPVVKVSIQA